MRNRTTSGYLRIVLGLLAASTLPATTLQQLSIAEMIEQSTAIVRARVTGSSTTLRGSDIYTTYQLDAVEILKAPPGTAPAPGHMQVSVPGGSRGGVRQTVAGAPELRDGQEYVVFLWSSRSGMTQLIGLSQGLFNVREEADGSVVLIRPAATELMLDESGHVVRDQPVSLELPELRERVERQTGNRGQTSGTSGATGRNAGAGR